MAMFESFAFWLKKFVERGLKQRRAKLENLSGLGKVYNGHTAGLLDVQQLIEGH